MTRFTVRLDDNSDLAEWVEQQADQRDRSKAWVVRESLAAAAGRESVYAGANRTGADHTDADRTKALRDRVAELERTVYGDTEESNEAIDAPDSAGVNARVQAAVQTVAESWQDEDERLHARREAAERVLQHAIDTGNAVGKSDAIDAFADDHGVDGQSDSTWWRKNIRPVLSEFGSYSNGAHGYAVRADDLPEL